MLDEFYRNITAVAVSAVTGTIYIQGTIYIYKAYSIRHKKLKYKA